MSTSVNIEVVRRDQYRERRDHIFGTAQALDWFVRNHKHELVENGAILMLGGRWMVNPQRFDECVIRAGERMAKRHAERATAQGRA